MARAKIKIDEEQLEKLGALQCTYEEIAAFFKCDKSTISRNYNKIVERGREQGKISLRRKQWKLADKSAAMAIFLGKNYLGQSDQQAQVQPETDIPKDIDNLTPQQIDEFYDKLRSKAN